MTEKSSVGLDFGTTNSLLTNFDYLENGPRPFRASMGEVNGPIPSLVVTKVAAKVKKMLAGLVGIEHYDDEDFEIRENFKLDLPKVGATTSERLSHKSFIAARDFLTQVIDDYRAASATGQIDSICITAPEAWVSGQEQIANEALLHILKSLDLHHPRIVSEPVAAAAYFADCYYRRVKQGFRGHAFVYDHGGGTLDLSLVKIEGVKVTPIEGDGLSIDDSPLGYGGVAFDRMVLDHFLETDEKMSNYSERDKLVWLRKFEKQKRSCPVDLERRYARLKAGLPDEAGELFEVPKVRKYKKPVSVEDIKSVFEKDYQPMLKERLDKFLDHCSRLEDAPNFANPNDFRVLMVGGFSEFYPVRRFVEDTFREKFDCEGEVFQNHFDRDDRWSAISLGACLVAANKVKVDELCPCTFGIVTFGETEEDLNYNPLLKRGDPVDRYDQVVYFEGGLFGADHLNESAAPSITFYFERAGDRIAMKGQTGLLQLLPDFGTAQSWKFGSKIEDGVIFIYILSDVSPNPRRIRIGEFFDVIDASEDRVISDQNIETVNAVA